MKNISKVLSVFGGCALLVGCGQAETVSGVAEGTAFESSAIQFNKAMDSSDNLLGYYSGCQGHQDGARFTIRYGSGGTTAGNFRITREDSGCQLWADGISAQDQKDGAGLKDGSMNPIVSTYGFFAVTDNESPSPILVRNNSVANPYTAGDAVLARKSTLAGSVFTPVASDVIQETMVNVASVNLQSDNVTPTSGALDFSKNFKILTIAGSAGDLASTTANASFIGYAYMVANDTTNLTAPKYTASAATDAIIKTNGSDEIITSTKYFRFNKEANAQNIYHANEYVYGVPSSALFYDGVKQTVATFAALTDLQRYSTLNTWYQQFGALQGVVPVNPSSTSVSIASDTLYPIGTNISQTAEQENVIIFAKKDGATGVSSYQAILLKLNYVP